MTVIEMLDAGIKDWLDLVRHVVLHPERYGNSKTLGRVLDATMNTTMPSLADMVHLAGYVVKASPFYTLSADDQRALAIAQRFVDTDRELHPELWR